MRHYIKCKLLKWVSWKMITTAQFNPAQSIHDHTYLPSYGFYCGHTWQCSEPTPVSA